MRAFFQVIALIASVMFFVGLAIGHRGMQEAGGSSAVLIAAMWFMWSVTR